MIQKKTYETNFIDFLITRYRERIGLFFKKCSLYRDSRYIETGNIKARGTWKKMGIKSGPNVFTRYRENLLYTVFILTSKIDALLV